MTVSGQSIVTILNGYTIAGCTFPAMSSGATTRATAQWTKPATRVTAKGQQGLVQDSPATSLTTGTTRLIKATQPRVSAICG